MERTMKIKLTEVEQFEAGTLGLRRSIKSRGQGLNKDKHGAIEHQIERDVYGAMAERALAKVLGIYCDPSINTFHAPDVGNLQVRSTTYSDGKLIIRPGDPPGQYVLVVCQPPEFNIVGVYQFSGQGDPADWYAPNPNRPPCWAITQAKLKSPDTLKG